jgi:hypothetical protein
VVELGGVEGEGFLFGGEGLFGEGEFGEGEAVEGGGCAAMPGPEEVRDERSAGSVGDGLGGAGTGFVVGVEVAAPRGEELGVCGDERLEGADEIVFLLGDAAVGEAEADDFVGGDAEAGEGGGLL